MTHGAVFASANNVSSGITFFSLHDNLCSVLQRWFLLAVLKILSFVVAEGNGFMIFMDVWFFKNICSFNPQDGCSEYRMYLISIRSFVRAPGEQLVASEGKAT